jgi:hypothetical protein
VEFNTAQDVENVIWNLKISDLLRQQNRALIDGLFNGMPPYTPQEQEQNRINTNVNDLTANRVFHDAARQFSNAFLTPANYFTVRLDSGPRHKRDGWSQIITTEINRRMKRSQRYRQTLRNVFAQLVLHGVGPVTWPDKYGWIPNMHAMYDVLVPSNTLITLENLSYFAIYRRYTAAQLTKLTSGPKVDRGWQMDVVKACLRWVQKQTGPTIASTDQDYTPERMMEDIKSNSAFYNSDAVPTVNSWDVYYLADEDRQFGWKRRIILDTPNPADASDAKVSAETKNIIDGRNQFLYTSEDRTYADRMEEIIHFQFADGSVVAPFRYHSVRSLGFLLYALCHLQNRLRCKVTDATFENLLNYIQVDSIDEAERLKKIDLINMGFLPPGWKFVNQTERWQVNQQLLQLMLNLMRQDTAESSPTFNQQFGQNDNSQVEKTATQITAEINKASSTIGTILQEAYGQQEPQYREICRRFCRPNSRDLDSREFRKACLRQGVPEEMLDSERWTISAERVLGNGSKQMEIAQSQLIMQQYPLLDPDGQRVALRTFLTAATSDPALVDQLKPETPIVVTESVHDAELSAATLLAGIPMGLKQGVNHGEYAATLLGAMNVELKKIEASGNVGTPDDVAGLQNIAGLTIDGQPIQGNGAAAHIQILAQDPQQKQQVKQLSDLLGKMLNEVKALSQRQAEQKQQQGDGNQLPAEVAAKLKGQMVISEAKAANLRESHAQRMQQRDEQHKLQLQQQQERDQLANANEIRRTQVDEAAKDLQTAADIRRQAAPEPVSP